MTIPKIIFEDASILVLDKPSGWITNSASTAKGQPVIQDWLRENFDYPLIGDRDARDGIVHRLDKETSGLLVVAKTKGAFDALQWQFKERIVKKTYITLVHGKVEPQTGEIKAPVGRLPWRRDRFGVIPGGREAVTGYGVIEYINIKGEECSLAEFKPETGRTHQVRIHAKYLGHPVIGDNFYAGRKTSRTDRLWCPRLFLHASKITFIHPQNGKRVTFESGLPKSLKEKIAPFHG